MTFMENLNYILSLAGTAVGLLITTVTFLAKFVKSAKAKKIAEQIGAIGNAVLPYIEQAEMFVNYSGAEKKEYVLTKANQFAIDNKMPFDPAAIAGKIEELVKLTKTVNGRDKDKIVEPAK